MRNVLFITYYWPPAGGVSVNRILNFYKYLPEYGWNPIILTIEKGNFPFVDPSLTNEVRNDTLVVKTPNHSLLSFAPKLIKEKEFVPYGFTDTSKLTFQKKVLRAIKFNLIPDTRISWYRPAIKAGLEILKRHNIDLIFSSSPPQTNHVIASRLASKQNIPWIADLRDPWSDVFWLKKEKIRFGIVSNMDRLLEKNVLKKAERLITVSPTWQKDYNYRIGKETHLIYNGFNEEVFDTVDLKGPVKEKKDCNKTFRILYTGSMSYQQRPTLFFETLKRLRIKNPTQFNQIEVEFIGNYPEFLKNMIQEAQLHDHVKITPFMPYRSVVSKITESDMLLIIGVEGENSGVIPSKIFDYLASDKPIIGYNLGSDTKELLRENDRYRSVSGQNIEDAEEFIISEFTSPSKGMNQDVSRYGRKAQTQQLAQIFDDVWNSRNR